MKVVYATLFFFICVGSQASENFNENEEAENKYEEGLSLGPVLQGL